MNKFLLIILMMLMQFSIVNAHLYPNSIVSTDFDFIHTTDPDTFMCLEYKREIWRTLPRNPTYGFEVQKAFLFSAYYNDGTMVDFIVDQAFGSQGEAEKELDKYKTRFGKLPTILRDGVDTIVINKGDGSATSDNKLFVLFSENADTRISNNDLEETMFHESIHSALDLNYKGYKDWLEVQTKDGKYVTEYAEEYPNREDMAESAIFAFVLAHHPERIPEPDKTNIQNQIPNRLEYLEKTFFPKNQPLIYNVAPPYPCDGSDTRFKSEAPSGSSSSNSDSTSNSDGMYADNNGHIFYQSGNPVDVISSSIFGLKDIDETQFKEFTIQWLQETGEQRFSFPIDPNAEGPYPYHDSKKTYADSYLGFDLNRQEAYIEALAKEFNFNSCELRKVLTEDYGYKNSNSKCSTLSTTTTNENSNTNSNNNNEVTKEDNSLESNSNTNQDYQEEDYVEENKGFFSWLFSWF